MKTYAPMNIIVHGPQTEEEKRKLETIIAGIHAEAVWNYVQKSETLSSEDVMEVIKHPI